MIFVLYKTINQLVVVSGVVKGNAISPNIFLGNAVPPNDVRTRGNVIQ